ncbi:MAG TPA: SDR family NAD(P)-dependent oxidoreductase [Dehalococcoidia bacterium]|nr:SDR family NAD(P)-dependent oxidoreductase [Dehalococcoidia bacterium]
MGRLEGRKALVTGGGSGIGRAVCLAFAREGADLAVVDKDPEGARAVAGEAQAIGRRAFDLTADLTREDQVNQAVTDAIARLGHLDICVANAGISGGRVPVAETSLAHWQRTVDGCLTTVFLTVRAVLPHMIERRGGRIITTSSQLAHKPSPLQSAYCAAKAGVVALTVSLAQEVVEYGIRVNTVAPGPTLTAMTGQGVARSFVEERIKRLPIGRIGRPEEIAPSFVFLASDDAEFMIGQTVSPNGGDVFW